LFPVATVIALAGPGRAGAIESPDAHAATAKRMAERPARWNARSIVTGFASKV
jgi:predicted small lipoprotein YifL